MRRHLTRLSFNVCDGGTTTAPDEAKRKRHAPVPKHLARAAERHGDRRQAEDESQLNALVSGGDDLAWA